MAASESRALTPRTANDGTYTAAQVAQAILDRMYERVLMGSAADSAEQALKLATAYSTVVSYGEIGITASELTELMSALASTPELQAVVQRLHVIR